MRDFVVNQSSLLSAGDGTAPNPLMSKMGLIPNLSKWDFLALQGRMFNTHEVTIGTALTQSAADAGAIVLTAPTVRFTVPIGTTVFPYRFNVNFVNGVGVEKENAFVVSDGDSYTSGGVALTAYNWRTDDTRSSAVTNLYHCSGGAIVEAALTNPRKYATHGLLYATAAVTDEQNLNLTWTFPDFVPCVGPCSVLIYLSAKTTAGTFEFDFSWGEVPSVNV